MSVGSVGGIGASGGGGAALTTPAASVESEGVSGAGAAQSVGTGQNPQEGAIGAVSMDHSSHNSCDMSTQNFVELHNSMQPTQSSSSGTESQGMMDSEMMKKMLELMMMMAVLNALQQMG